MKAGKQFGFFQVANLTATELLRQPICLLLTTSALVFVSLLPVLLTHNLGETGKLVRDSALATVFFTSLLFSAAAACGAVRNEMQGGTAASVLSKPISRSRFLLAKFVGVSAVLLLFVYLLSLAVLMAERSAEVPGLTGRMLGVQFSAVILSYAIAGIRNFRRRKAFPSSAMICLTLLFTAGFLVSLGVQPSGSEESHSHVDLSQLATGQEWTLLPACCLLAFAALMLQSLALFCATRLRVVPTLTICATFFVLGLMADYLFGSHSSWWAQLAYTLLPNWQHFWMADALTGDGYIPWNYVLRTLGYSAAWTGGVVLLAMGSFERMEVK